MEGLIGGDKTFGNCYERYPHIAVLAFEAWEVQAYNFEGLASIPIVWGTINPQAEPEQFIALELLLNYIQVLLSSRLHAVGAEECR